MRKKKHMNTYQLKGQCTIIQYCHVVYPESTKVTTLTECASNEDCDGHEITCDVDETVEGVSPDDAIGNWSLSQYEYKTTVYGDHDGLEPTWCNEPEVRILTDLT